MCTFSTPEGFADCEGAVIKQSEMVVDHSSQDSRCRQRRRVGCYPVPKRSPRQLLPGSHIYHPTIGKSRCDGSVRCRMVIGWDRSSVYRKPGTKLYGSSCSLIVLYVYVVHGLTENLRQQSSLNSESADCGGPFDKCFDLPEEAPSDCQFTAMSKSTELWELKSPFVSCRLQSGT